MSQYSQLPGGKGIVTSDTVNRRVRRLPYRWLGVGAVVVIGLAVSGVYFNNAHRTRPTNQSARSASSTSLTHQQQLTAALNAAEQQVSAAKTAPQKAAAYAALGTVYLNKADHAGAITAYTTAVQADDASKIKTLPLLAYAYYASGNRSQAIATYQQLVALLNQQPSLYDAAHQAMSGEAYNPNPAQIYQHVIQVLQQGGSI